jgi:hypothetical protein
VNRPYLLLDIDGVLCPTVSACPEGFQPFSTPNMPEDGTFDEAWFAAVHGDWLHELSESFELVWASAWGYTANAVVGPILSIPELAFVPFPPLPFHPSEKVPAIDAFVGERPAAWIDDLLTDEAHAWAAARPHPTLLVPAEPHVGLTREHVDELLAWPRSLVA